MPVAPKVGHAWRFETEAGNASPVCPGEDSQGHYRKVDGTRHPDAHIRVISRCDGVSTHRFTRTQRLLRAVEFQRIFAAGKPAQAGGQSPRVTGRSSDRLLTILWCDNGLHHARLGLAIAKRHVPRAVARNRIKRQTRESFRNHQQGLGSRDIIVLARPDAQRASKAALCASLRTHWQKMLKATCATSSSG